MLIIEYPFTLRIWFNGLKLEYTTISNSQITRDYDERTKQILQELVILLHE